ncbi:tetratricopeptide repeat-containing sensor histidine kinase [Algibacter pectinivorans]|nr:tetratricopeptide repeat-containing sensor histidine kinase [Algibacter pectinivorans]
MLSICASFAQTNDIDKLTLDLAFQNKDSLKIETSLKLIKALYDIKDYERAKEYILKSEKLSNKINYKKAIAAIVYYKSLIYAQHNDYLNAISGYNKSKTLFASLKDTLSVAKVNNSIGLLEIKKGRFKKGVQFSLSAIREFEKRGLDKDLSSAYKNLAQAYNGINLTDYAITYYEKALEIQTKLNEDESVLNTQNELADLYALENRHYKAINCYKNILKHEFSANDSVLGSILPKLGREYLKLSNLDSAEIHLTKSLKINSKIINKNGLLITLNNLGNINLKKGNLKTAEKQLAQAGSIAKSLNNSNGLLNYYRLMTALDSTKKHFNSAFKWQSAYYKLHNSLIKNEARVNYFNQEQDSAEIEEKNLNSFELEEKKSTPSNQVDNALSLNFEKTLSRYKLIVYALVGGLLVISTLLILIYLKQNRLVKYTQELEERNIKLDIKNADFLEQTKHLENINNVKDRLFSIVSHDLKDSLSSINGFINLLQEGTLSKKEFDALIPELSENANNASLLLFNLLNWSKSQMQSLEPKPSLFDIQEVFDAKINLVEQRVEGKGIELINNSLRDFVYADRSMFEIVIQNLLANAIKFSRTGDTVTVANHISSGSCIISISDTGIGISKEDQTKLFKSNTFTTNGTANEKGTGLGLSICKELVELNHGKIWVDSTLGEGSTFYVQLPKAKR